MGPLNMKGADGIRALGTFLVGISVVLSVTGDNRFQLAGVIFAIVGIGLRIEVAIRDRDSSKSA